MKYRKLRIAWSVTWGVVAVLLLMLWVRSYWRYDVVFYPTTRPIIANLVTGVIQVNQLPNTLGTGWGPGLGRGSDPTWMSVPFENLAPDVFNKPTWLWLSNQMVTVINFPVWSVVLVFLVASAAPWLPWRFSLRTRLIATTLVAVVLGVIVWLNK